MECQTSWVICAKAIFVEEKQWYELIDRWIKGIYQFILKVFWSILRIL